MSEQPKCDGISSDSIQNTSPQAGTSHPLENGGNVQKRQKKRTEIENEEGDELTKFQPYDLKLLTFKPIGSEQEVDVWHATASQFHAYIQQYAKGFGKVNTSLWPLAERLAVLNVIWERFRAAGRPFPFTQHQQVVPDVNGEGVPDVNGDDGTSASEAM
jgi:hypothetical protein